jgi:hypothetical protein
MARRDIDGDIAFLWVKAKSISAHEPVFALLLCRQIGEAILMKKHIEMLPEGVEPKTILTLGDLDNQKLNMKQYFTAIQIASLRYIQDMTNPFIHYRIDGEKVPAEKHVERLLQQVEEFMDPATAQAELVSDFSNQKINSDLPNMSPEMRRKYVKKTGLGWKAVMVNELEHFKWPEISDTILCDKVLNECKGRCTRRINRLKKELTQNPNAEVDDIRMKINGMEEKRNSIVNIGKMKSEAKMDLIKSATESILVAYYSRFGGKNYYPKEIKEDFIDKALKGVFKQHTKDTFYQARSGKYRKYWEFLFTRIGPKKRLVRNILLKDDWQFMYFS